MKLNLMYKLKLTAILLIIVVTGFAQKFDLAGPVKLDPKIRAGVLENGLKYYIFGNKFPEKRGEFYIVTNVGAIQEDDDQNGLAHFAEHMAFNGTKNFPQKGILNYLEKNGVKFGQNVNAGTGVEQTMYNMSNVPILREGIIDSALLILHDWSHYISFEEKEIDLERGVIREEWRMYGSANERMSNKLAPIKYKDSKYAKRDIIGDTAVINHFKYETIRNFYKKWYRPDLQAVVLVGDFDVDAVEAKVKKLFSSIPKVENPTLKEEYLVPDNKEPLIGIASDKEATATEVWVYFKHNNIKDKDKNLGFMRIQYVRSFINSMFGQRMSELSRKDNPPFVFAYCFYSGFTRSKDAFTGFAQAKPNEAQIALTALLTEMERMKLHGFTAGEFDRAKANFFRSLDSRFMDREKRKNYEIVYPIISNFIMNNPNPGIEFEYEFAKEIIPTISLEEINAEAKKYVTNENIVVTVTGPEKEGVTLPTEKEILNVLSTYKSGKIDAYVDNLSGKKLIEKLPPAGKVTATKENKNFETKEWTLSNGIKIILKPTDFKEDELLIRGYSEGGLSLLKQEDVLSGMFLGSVVSQMGVSEFSLTDLSKMLAGKRASVSLSLGEDQEGINGRTSPKDLETALQLIHLYLTKPRWNDNEFKTLMDKQRAYYQNADADPRKVFYDTVSVMLSNHSPRTTVLNSKTLEKISFEKIKSIYADRFSDPGNFTFQFVGKINLEEVKPLIEKYLGSLPSVKRTEKYKDNGVRPPKGKVVNDFSKENKTPRTSVFVVLSGKCNFTFQDRLNWETLKHILDLRYTETIREEQGGTYGVSVSAGISRLPENNFKLYISFDTDPLKADMLKDIVYKELQKLADNGPTENDLHKATEFFLKQRQENLKENNWWNSMIYNNYYDNINMLTGYDDAVKALTTKSLQEYAKKVLTQGNAIEIIMRPL
ncbi:MAG: M16 family metallopeptidase [Tenuifilaceae bacterium]